MNEYASRRITQLQRQYNMLVKSIIFSNNSEKQDIYYELNKLENSILDETNDIYNSEYNKLINKKTSLLKEEKERLVSLIELIENRRRYVDEELEKHRRNVNISFEYPTILGIDKIEEFKKKIRIIDKYSQNIILRDKLVKELDDIKDKLNKSEAKIRTNERINKELETKMIDMLEKSFKAMEIYSYKEREEEIELAFNELNFAKEKAVENVENARRSSNASLVVECEKLYDSIEEEYRKYFEKKMILNLLYMYDRVVKNYDELLAKRREINDILVQIDSSDFYKLVFNEINKQYNTIKLEQQDVKTFKSLSDEKQTKERLLNQIEKENNSEEFFMVLDELLKNEKIKHDKEEQEKRKVEYEERQKKLIEDSKKQEEIRKKQKIIEEKRKREIEIRTKELLEKQKTGVIPKLNSKKDEVVVNSDKTLENKVYKANENKENISNFYPINQGAKNKEFVNKSLKKEINDDHTDKLDVPNFFSVKEETRDDISRKKVDNIKHDDVEIPSFFPIKEESKKEDKKSENAYDSIMQEDKFTIPVIKNDGLVAKKVKEEKASENDVDEFMRKFLENSKKEEVEEVNDMIFPDMPN